MALAHMLSGKKVRLTAVTEEDLVTINEWYQDPDFLRLYDSTPAYPQSKGESEERIKEAQEDPNTFLFAIRGLGEETLIGLLEMDGIAWSHGTTFVSIGIGEAHNRGQGYGREAMELALQFAFHELNLHRVCLTVFSYNEAALQLYEKLGFVQEGTYREHLLRDGQRYDMHLYGLLRDEWEEGRRHEEATG